MPRQVGEDVRHLRVPDGRQLEVLARRGSAGQHEDARADDGADAEGGQRPRAERLFQTMLGLLRVGDQLVDGLGGE